MDASQFDRLTRRLVLGGLAGGALSGGFGPSQGAAKGLSKRKRCKKRHRVFCAGRCCPKERRCEHGACVASCDDPFDCSPGSGAPCGPLGACFCTSTVSGASACMDVPAAGECNLFPACTGNGDCDAGLACVICSCVGLTADRRCLPPCGAT